MATFWNGADPVGRRFALDTGPNRHVDHGRRDRRRLPAVWRGHARFRRSTTCRTVRNAFGGRIMARTEGIRQPISRRPSGPRSTRRTPQTPVEEVQTLDELRNGRLAVPGLTAALLSIFAAIALVITLAGIAGLIGTSVSQRTREFGLRMALGASRGSVLKLVLSQGDRARGRSASRSGSAAPTRSASSSPASCSRRRPRTSMAYAATALLFIAAALIAALGPARRATSVDPLTALRAE